MMNFINADERPDFTTTEYRETLELHRQSDFLNFFENEFEVAMDGGDDLELQPDLAIDFLADQIPLKLQPLSKYTSMIDIDDRPAMDLDEDEDPPTKPKAPKGFLDLPRELRQTIIDFSHENKEVNIKDWYEAYKYVDWANVLRKVHPLVEEDVNYSEKCWNKRVVVTWPVDIPKKGLRIDRDVPNLVAAERVEEARLERVRDRIKELGRDPTIGSG